MNVHRISDLDTSTMRAILGSSPPVLFVGSGISLWSPSDLPTGNQFTQAVFSLLFRDYVGKYQGGYEETVLKKYFNKLPFEVINERCPDPAAIRDILKHLYGRTVPNPVHELIANQLLDRKIQSVITPNYDCCLDMAIKNAEENMSGGHYKRVIRVIREVDSRTPFVHGDPIYFKIHGSTDDVSGESLVFRLNQEGVLPPWKRMLTRNMIQDQTLLIIGYSGSDFDICPEIALANPRQVFWNFLKWDENEIPPNINFLSERCELNVIEGDMRDVLSLSFQPLIATFGKSNIDVENLLKRAFDHDAKRLWRIRVCNSINYNKPVIKEINEAIGATHNPADRIQLLSERAGALASSGKYRSAAKDHDYATQIAEKNSMSSAEVISQVLIACDAWRCYGGFIRSFMRFQKAKYLIEKMPIPLPNLLADLDRNLLLLIRHPYDLFSRFHMKKVANIFQRIASGSVTRSVKYYRENGSWYQLQQVGLWRERFHLSNQDSIHGNEYETPLSNDGYSQLNFPMGRMMAFRHGFVSSKVFTGWELAYARQLIADAKTLGITPEIWKIGLLILRKAKKSERSYDDLVNFVQAFQNCQYSFLFRIWRLFVGE